MELEGYELVMRSIEIALAIRREVAEHPIISKYFRVLGGRFDDPGRVPRLGLQDFLTPGSNWVTALKAVREDEFFLDPTRMTLVCGTAGFDGTSFKGLLASKYNIQLNKTSRNSVLLQSNINNTRSDVALPDQGAARDLARRSTHASPRAARPSARRSRRGSRA